VEGEAFPFISPRLGDAIAAPLAEHLSRTFGVKDCDRYWEISEQARRELGYAGYLGALERFGLEKTHDPKVLLMSSWLADYPFGDRIYKGALSAVQHVQQWCPA